MMRENESLLTSREEKLWRQSLLLMVLLGGVVLRFSELGQESLWMDEAHTVMVARLSSVQEVSRVVLEDVHPPLFFIVAHFWIKLSGTLEVALRALPALFGSISLYLLALWARALNVHWKAALIGCFLFAINPHAIWYSQEFRMYSLLTCLGLLHLWSGTRTLRPEKGCRSTIHFSVWVVSGMLLILCHFFGAFFWMAGLTGLLVFAVSLHRRQGTLGRRFEPAQRTIFFAERQFWIRLTIAGLCWIASSIPLIRTLLTQLKSGSRIEWLQRYPVTWSTPWEIMSDLLQGPQLDVSLVWLTTATILASLFLLGLSVLAAIRPGKRIRISLLAPALVCAVLITAPTFISIWKVIILRGDRYLDIAVAPLCLAMGIGFHQAFRRAWYYRSIAVLCLVFLTVSPVIFLSVYYRGREKTMWREAVAAVRGLYRPGDFYITEPEYLRLPIDYYAEGVPPRFSAGAERIPNSVERLWMIVQSKEPIPADALVMASGYRPKTQLVVDSGWPFTRVRVTLYERPGKH